MPNGITLTGMSLYPSVEVGSVIVSYAGDDNHNSWAQVSYRRPGGQWRNGVILTNDFRDEYRPGYDNPYKNQFRGCIFGLSPDTKYEIAVTVHDPDGVTGDNPIFGTLTTWDNNPASIGNTYWVSLTGAYGDTGSEANPFSVDRAIEVVLPGDTVMFLPGDYYRRIFLLASGLPDNYITWRSADPDNKARIILNTGEYGTFRSDGASYNRIKELELINTMAKPVVYLKGNTKGTILEDSIVRPEGGPAYWSDGVAMNGAGIDRTIIQRDLFLTHSQGDDAGPFCVMQEIKAPGTVFADNIVSSEDGGVGRFGDSVNAGLILNGHVYRNTIKYVYDDGMELERDGICCSAFENKISKGGRSDFGVAPVLHGPTYVVRNIPFGPHLRNGCGIKQGSASHGFLYFYHNDFALSGLDAIAAIYGSGDSATENTVFRNNILMHCGGGNGYVVEEGGGSYGQTDYDYNCMYTWRQDVQLKWLNTRMKYADWRANYGMEQHGIWGDPMFVDIANGDARLQAGSPCIDAGLIIPGINDLDSPWPYSGGGPDIGAIESGQVGPPSASFTAQPVSGEAPLEVFFTNNSTGAIDSFCWEFGDGETSTEEHPVHTYQEDGDYTVTLTAGGPGGSDSSILTVKVTSGAQPPPPQNKGLLIGATALLVGIIALRKKK